MHFDFFFLRKESMYNRYREISYTRRNLTIYRSTSRYSDVQSSTCVGDVILICIHTNRMRVVKECIRYVFAYIHIHILYITACDASLTHYKTRVTPTSPHYLIFCSATPQSNAPGSCDFWRRHERWKQLRYSWLHMVQDQEAPELNFYVNFFDYYIRFYRHKPLCQ